MRNSFAAKITVPIVILIILSLIIIGLIAQRNSQEAFYTSLEEQGLIMSKVVATNSANALKVEDIVEEVLNENMLAQAHLVNELLLTGRVTEAYLRQLSATTGIDEFWITDGTREVVLTNVDGGMGFVFPDDPEAQTYDFIKLIGAPGETVTQRGMVRELDDKVFKYVGVGRKDTPGIVQVGAEAQKVAEIKRQVGIQQAISALLEQDFLEYAAVLDAGGEVYLQERLSEHGVNLQGSEHITMALREQKEAASVVKYGGDEYVEVVLPWQDYTFVLGLNTANVQSSVVQNQIKNKRQLFGFSFLVALTVTVLVYWIARNMTRPLGELTRISALVSAGELFHRSEIKSDDEIGQLARAYNGMLDEISDIVRRLARSINQITDAFTQLATAAAESSRGAGETAAGMNELAAGAKIIADNVEKAGGHMQRSDALTNAGAREINEVVTQMESILNMAREASAATRGLDEKAATIGQILDMITGIADQTNLLALNAAIEAARAGENGRGFAVVAEEVRQLAEQSADAARQIGTLVMDMQAGTQETTALIAAETEEIQEGSAKVTAVGRSFEEIAASVRDLTADFNQINRAVAPMSDEIANVAAVAEEQSATSQQVTATIDVLNNLARELDQMVQRFRLDK